MKEYDFTGRTCLVTGGASGMGRELVLKYAEHNANLAIIDLNEKALADIREELGRKHISVMTLKADVSSLSAVDSAIEEVQSAFGAINVLANCAGISTSKMILDVEIDEWDRVMNINLKSVYLLSRRVAQNMIRHNVKNGKIITISSISSKIGEYGNGVYSVSKAGINNLTQVLAQELGEYGISISAVCPGYVNTELMQQAIRTRAPLEGMTAKEYEAHLLKSVPLGRMVEPEEVAGFMLYLSTDMATYFSGVSLTMAGGKMLI